MLYDNILPGNQKIQRDTVILKTLSVCKLGSMLYETKYSTVD